MFPCCLSGCDWPEYFPAGIRVWEKQVRTSVSRRPAAMCICRRRRDGGDSLSCRSLSWGPAASQAKRPHTQSVAILVPSSRRNCLLPLYIFTILHQDFIDKWTQRNPWSVKEVDAIDPSSSYHTSITSSPLLLESEWLTSVDLGLEECDRKGGDGWDDAWGGQVVLEPRHLAAPQRHLGELRRDAGGERGVSDRAKWLCQVRRPLVPDPPGPGGDRGEAVGGEVPLQAAWGQAGLEGQSEEGSCWEPGAGEGVQREGDHRLGQTCQRHWHDSHSGDNMLLLYPSRKLWEGISQKNRLPKKLLGISQTILLVFWVNSWSKKEKPTKVSTFELIRHSVYLSCSFKKWATECDLLPFFGRVYHQIGILHDIWELLLHHVSGSQG